MSEQDNLPPPDCGHFLWTAPNYSMSKFPQRKYLLTRQLSLCCNKTCVEVTKIKTRELIETSSPRNPLRIKRNVKMFQEQFDKTVTSYIHEHNSSQISFVGYIRQIAATYSY